MVALISFLLEIIALIIAIVNGTGRGARAPLWVAVVCLALALILPRLVIMAI